MRFTNEHNNFKDAMKIIFDLEKHLNKIKESSYYTDNHTILLVAKLCHKTIPNFSPSVYYPGAFRYRDRMETIILQGSRNHEDERSFLKDFVHIMCALREDIKKRSYNLLSIDEIIRQTRGYNYLKDSGYKEWIKNAGSNKNIKDYDWMKYERYMASKYKREYIDNNPICEIRESLPKGDIQAAWRAYDFFTNKILNEPPFLHESFKITYKTGSNFYKSLGMESPQEEISSPGYSNSQVYFIEVFKYILVKYVTLFGSLNRIKICRRCNSLFFEKKYGYGIYCNDYCRVNFNVAAEKKEVYNCRARQNKWLDRELSELKTVKIKDCEKCRKWKSKSGKCEKALEKNKDALEERTPKIRHTN